MDKINNYEQYINELEGRGDVFVFRGQANSQFVLIPSGLRPEHINEADEQMFLFVDEMKKIFKFDELTCIEIAQHFALPTRMLDFSYSYDVALFFACHEQRGRYMDEDGKVFVFNKTKYMRKMKELNPRIGEVTSDNKLIYEWLEKYIEKNRSNSDMNFKYPIVIDATEQFDRLHMQKGLFLLWGEEEGSLESIMERNGLNFSDYVDTIVVDKDAKPYILEQLAKKHISEDTLFMNITKIKDLATEIKAKK